jgi:hypothetical protein
LALARRQHTAHNGLFDFISRDTCLFHSRLNRCRAKFGRSNSGKRALKRAHRGSGEADNNNGIRHSDLLFFGFGFSFYAVELAFSLMLLIFKFTFLAARVDPETKDYGGKSDDNKDRILVRHRYPGIIMAQAPIEPAPGLSLNQLQM